MITSKLITVARAGYIHRACYYKELLNNAGIESIILDQGIDGAQGRNEIELQVEEEDVPKALEILDEANAGYEVKEIKDTPVSSIRNILVPVDFSPLSVNAAKYALHVARQKSASIMFIHALYDGRADLISYESFYSYPPELKEAHHQLETDAAEQMNLLFKNLNEYMDLEGLAEVKPRHRIMAGNPEEVVLSMIESGQFDLVIIGSKGVVPFDFWFGTLVTALIEKSIIPVLTIPEEVVYNKSNFKRLMYATDFDKSDGIAIRRLLNIAAPLETQIHIVHIDETDDNAFINFNLAHFKEKYIGQIENVKMIFDLILNDNIVQGIQNYIKQEKIDILAVTTHKRNVISSFFKPSLTKELYLRMSIPLLVFHSNL